MRKLWLIAIVLIVLAALPASATTYYANACNGQNINGGTCTWNVTKGASCAASSTALTWPPAAGDILDLNGCATIVLNVDPGANGLVTLTTDATNTGGTFTCDVSTGTATITANATGTASASAVVTISGTGGTKCQFAGSGVLTGGSASGAHAVSDTHTVNNLSHTLALCQGGTTSANTAGYLFNSASGVDTLSCNARAGTGGPGVSTVGSSGSAITLNGNCVGNDTASGGATGCGTSNAASSGAITVTKDLIDGKYTAARPGGGKVYWVPGALTNAYYTAANSTYQATDVADSAASYATKSSPTLTNATWAPACLGTNTTTGICNVANVLLGIQYGLNTGTATSGGASGSAH